MTRIARVAKGLGALVLLGALVGGVPWALWHFIGWPLPHHVPSATQVGRALNRQGIPAQTLIDALAVVVWLTWAALLASLAVEVPAALSGRHPPRLPVAGIFQPLTGHLVAAVIVACLAVAPRPGHTGPFGAGGSGLAASVRRPVAALAVDDAVYSSAVGQTQPAPASSTTAPPGTATMPAPASTNPAEPTVYVVQRGDTLWGIAQRELGDPLRWSEIYQLNEGRPQPDGATLTDPHWIDPGWTLVLPALTTPAPSPDSAPPPPSSPQITGPAPSPAVIKPTTTSTTAGRPQTSAPSSTNGSGHHHGVASSAAPVRLPSGSVVAGSFAAGVLSAVALGRFRRRHAYRYRPPEPGRNLAPAPHRPTLDHLTEMAQPSDGIADPDDVNLPVFPVDDDARRLDPGRLEIGTREGAVVTVEVTDLSGVAMRGPSVDDVARGLIAGLLVRAVPGATEILLTDELTSRLLPGIRPDRSLRRVDSAEGAARAVEAERIGRTRRMDLVGASDAVRFRHDNPENPLPLLLVLLDAVPAQVLGRWAALLDDASRLGIAVIFLGDSPIATAHLDIDTNGSASSSGSNEVAHSLAGTSLYGLPADEAVELLDAVNEANQEVDEENTHPTEPPNSINPLRPDDDADLRSDDPPESVEWPQLPELPDHSTRPIRVEMLGPFHIAVHGESITSGLRGRASALFGWYLLRPEGATSDEAVDALWPDTTPDQIRRQFWRSFGDLRTRLRSNGDTTLEVLEKTGEHYRPNSAEITCDLWDFQAALGTAARARDDKTARTALRNAVETYRGDLLSGVGYHWVEPVRQDLHRRALDAHLRLAELDERAGQPELATEILERVIDLDRYAEEPYRRLMTIHAAHGRPDAVTATFHLLRSRLTDLDVDMDDTTARLYRSLTTDTPPARSIRLSS